MKRNQFFLTAVISAFVLLPGSVMPGPKPKQLKENPDASMNLSIYWIDTEGGAATLIVTPAGESVLIDTGNPGERDADRIYRVAHTVAGLKQIDHLVTTHWHIDHYGGAVLSLPDISLHSIRNANTNLFQLSTASIDFNVNAMYDIRLQKLEDRFNPDL